MRFLRFSAVSKDEEVRDVFIPDNAIEKVEGIMGKDDCWWLSYQRDGEAKVLRVMGTRAEIDAILNGGDSNG